MTNKTNKKKDSKKKVNGLLVFTITVIAIPLGILALIIFSSLTQKGEPVFGSRFDTQLDPAIEKSALKDIEESINFENIDSKSVNLNAATLRILVDANDAVDAATIEAIANQVYDIVNSNLDIATYFTTQDTTKMYDLEIHVYNYIPDEENEEEVNGQLYAVLYKNATTADKAIDWSTTIKDGETYESIQEALRLAEEAAKAAELEEKESE